MTVTLGRRELLAALGSAAAWPLAAHAQQQPGIARGVVPADTQKQKKAPGRGSQGFQ